MNAVFFDFREIDSEEQVLFEKKMTEEARQEVERDLCNRDSFSHAHDTALLEQVYPSRLEIIEISARHLPKLDLYGKCDPYCRITFCSQTKITSIQKTTYCPDWDEVLTFKLPAFQEITPMKIELFDHDFDSGPDYVGQAILSKEDIQDVIGDFNPNKTWTTMKAFKLCSADHQPTIGADQLRSTLKIFFRLSTEPSKSGAPSPTGEKSRASSSGSAWDLLRKTGSSCKGKSIARFLKKSGSIKPGDDDQ
uniref:C2 domain-containing protein n=1 Tax=Guillardia theta TaxID=55529 RepID=A0A7S4UTB6_GUITH|mmetsp:Transcript_46138/g.144725  ORF Transcript_46138/g.144725 Transcript_46138/m.144725 type:complete len:250 (+) Transcript_46138:658-1407(+)